jgi:hypothetical protein
MIEQRTELFERMKGRLLSYVVQRSPATPREGLEGIPGEALTVAFERFLHEIVLCLIQGGVMSFLPGAVPDEGDNSESAAVCSGRGFDLDRVGAVVGE